MKDILDFEELENKPTSKVIIGSRFILSILFLISAVSSIRSIFQYSNSAIGNHNIELIMVLMGNVFTIIFVLYNLKQGITEYKKEKTPFFSRPFIVCFIVYCVYMLVRYTINFDFYITTSFIIVEFFITLAIMVMLLLILVQEVRYLRKR